MSSPQRPPYELIPEWASRASIGAGIAFAVLGVVTLATDVTPFENSVGFAFLGAAVAVLFAGASYGAIRWLAAYGLGSGVERYTSGNIREAVSLTVPLFSIAGILGVLAAVSGISVIPALISVFSALLTLAVPLFVRFQAWRATLDNEDGEEPLDRL